MDISVIGKHVDLGQALRAHVELHLTDAVGKYFSKPIDAQVIFSREAHEFRAEIIVHAARGVKMQAHADASDAYAAFDAALTKAAKRLRRQKRKIRDHHKKDDTDQVSTETEST